MRSPTRSSRAAVAAIIGALIWFVSWYLNGQTAEGNRRVFGLTEGNYRAMLNPAFILLTVSLVELFRLHRSHIGRWGKMAFAITGFGLLLFVLGNLVEFGLFGGRLFVDLGWIIVLISLLVQAVGYVLAGIVMMQAKVLPVWSRPVPVLMGVLFGSIAFDVSPLLPILAFSVGWILLGIALWSTPKSSSVLT